jgi:hypothetical protein
MANIIINLFPDLQFKTMEISTNKTDRHNITEILLKVVLNIINLTFIMYI